jgi:hypothetical protein
MSCFGISFAERETDPAGKPALSETKLLDCLIQTLLLCATLCTSTMIQAFAVMRNSLHQHHDPNICCHAQLFAPAP